MTTRPDHNAPAPARETGLTPLTVGFVPLTDCASLVVAREKGFAASEGIDLILDRQLTWAAVRDKVAFGHHDAAHLLAGLPIALSLGVGEMRVPMIVPMALGTGGNAITLSAPLFRQMGLVGQPASSAGRIAAAAALARLIAERRELGLQPLRLAAVYPFSSHYYELRYWLASGGIDPDQDVDIVIVSPPRMVEQMRIGVIDGFCVGEPWNQLAISEGIGCIVATKADIWPLWPEKVLAMREDRWREKPAAMAALVRALVKAAAWAEAPANRQELAGLLAAPQYIGVDAALLEANLADRPRLVPGMEGTAVAGYHLFHGQQATVPFVEHAAWLHAQMRRWGQATGPAGRAELARIYRPDLYAEALDIAVPHAPAGGFGPSFGGPLFDPSQPDAYVESFEIRRPPARPRASAAT